MSMVVFFKSSDYDLNPSVCFQSFDLDWLFRFRSPADIWEHHPDLLKLELCCYTCAVLTFLHGSRHVFEKNMYLDIIIVQSV